MFVTTPFLEQLPQRIFSREWFAMIYYLTEIGSQNLNITSMGKKMGYLRSLEYLSILTTDALCIF